jgi:hypothetical protein
MLESLRSVQTFLEPTPTRSAIWSKRALVRSCRKRSPPSTSTRRTKRAARARRKAQRRRKRPFASHRYAITWRRSLASPRPFSPTCRNSSRSACLAGHRPRRSSPRRIRYGQDRSPIRRGVTHLTPLRMSILTYVPRVPRDFDGSRSRPAGTMNQTSHERRTYIITHFAGVMQ